MKYKLVRGAMDLVSLLGCWLPGGVRADVWLQGGVANRVKSRSKFGTKIPRA